jgi:hypothetical protein
MPINFPEIKGFGAAPFEAFSTATASAAKGLQAIAAETTNYSKSSFEKTRAHFEKLVGLKNINEAMQLQSAFTKSAYDDFMAQGAKIGEMYSTLAKEAFKPIMASSQPPATAPQWKAPATATQNSSSAE